MALVRRCHGPPVLPDREWSETGLKGVDVKAWTICYTLPLIPDDLAVSGPVPDSIKTRFGAKIATVDMKLGIQESGHDLGVGSSPLEPPLTTDEMDRWHAALVLQAKSTLAPEAFDVTRAYYDKETHILLIGGLFSSEKGRYKVPLVFSFASEGGGDEWTGTFDIDDGFTGSVTDTMKAAFQQWVARGRNLTGFPFLPPLETVAAETEEPPAKKARVDPSVNT